MVETVAIRRAGRRPLGVQRPAVTTAYLLLAVLLTAWCWCRPAAAEQKQNHGQRTVANRIPVPSADPCPPGPTGSDDAGGYAVPARDDPYSGAVTPYPAIVPPVAPWQPAPAQPARPTVDLADVIRLAEAAVDEKVILNHLRGRELSAPLTADDLILLTEKGVGTRVILALQDLSVDGPRSQPARLDTRAAPPAPGPVPTSQVLFVGPAGMIVNWDVGMPNQFDSEPLYAPGRQDFPQGAIYRLRISNIPGREEAVLYPTLEIAPAMRRTGAFLAHNSIPVQLTEEDLDQVMGDKFVTKVMYLPDKEFQDLAVEGGVETLVSTRLDPGQDPIIEADRRGSILAVLRLGNKDLGRNDAERPGGHKTRREDANDSSIHSGSRAASLARDSGALEYRSKLRIGRRLETRPQLIWTSEELRGLLDRWERTWWKDRPDHKTPYRTHGGLI